jgi:hypothetical protein
MSYKIKVFFIFLLFCFLISNSIEAKEVKLKAFGSSEYINSDELLKNGSLAVLFQPSCSSCKMQISSLTCLESDVEKIYLLGSFANETKVRRSYLKKTTPYEGYYVSQKDLRDLGFDSSLAPQSLFFIKGKVLRFTGFTDCEKIKAKIKENSV